MTREEMVRIRDSIRIVKVTATRSIKSPGGDNFISFTASFDTTSPDDGEPSGEGALSLKEAKLAAHLVSLQAEVCAHEHAAASGVLGLEQANRRIEKIRSNFKSLISRHEGAEGNHE